jgi:hypothetical protein
MVYCASKSRVETSVFTNSTASTTLIRLPVRISQVLMDIMSVLFEFHRLWILCHFCSHFIGSYGYYVTFVRISQVLMDIMSVLFAFHRFLWIPCHFVGILQVVKDIMSVLFAFHRLLRILCQLFAFHRLLWISCQFCWWLRRSELLWRR